MSRQCGLYEVAIRSARQHGFVQNEGLAHEVAARFYAVRGYETFVTPIGETHGTVTPLGRG